jgi:DNA polymerase (family 10)
VPTHNADIAVVLGEIADLREIRGDNPFRIRAYRNAARNIGEFGRDITSPVPRRTTSPCAASRKGAG